jgi:hypothetical protein
VNWKWVILTWTSVIREQQNGPQYSIHICLVKVKVKQSRYRPGVAQKVPGSYGSQIS